jgi:carbonic anhydrase
MWTHTKESQAKITPESAVEFLKEGNKRFLKNRQIDRDYLKQAIQTARGQYPFAVVLSCIDSRTTSELIFDQGIGDIFSIRVAGNVLNNDILASMEYACAVAGSKLVVVLGHTNCGAVTSACNNFKMGHITELLSKIKPAIDNEKETISQRNGTNPDFVNNVTKINVKLVIEAIRLQSSILSELEANKNIIIVGANYDIESGLVEFF